MTEDKFDYNHPSFASFIEDGIDVFTELINLDKAEKEFQLFFEENLDLFKAFGYLNAIPQPVIETSKGNFIPDFIVQRDDGLWEILELKRPDTKLLKKKERRNSWYAEMHSNLSQCIDYTEALRDQTVLKSFEEKYNVRMHQGFPVTIFAGLSEHMDQVEVSKMLDRLKANFSLVSFDQALSYMQSWYAGKYPQAEDRSGFSIALLYQLDTFQNPNGCLFDMGWHPDKNRVSIHRKTNDVITIRLIDKDGLTTTNDFISPDITLGHSVALIINVFPVNGILRVVIEADGLQIADIRSSILKMNLSASCPLVTGNDFEESGSACFYYEMILTRGPTLTLNERAKLREHLKQRYYNFKSASNGNVRGIKCGPKQFMYSVGHPYFDPDYEFCSDMVQRNNDLRPSAS